jgi:hypothetical protein
MGEVVAILRERAFSETVARLRAIQALIEAAAISAETLDVDDATTKRELFDSLAVAQISVFRLLEDEGYSVSLA